MMIDIETAHGGGPIAVIWTGDSNPNDEAAETREPSPRGGVSVDLSL